MPLRDHRSLAENPPVNPHIIFYRIPGIGSQ
jgi:hypothetical protein